MAREYKYLKDIPALTLYELQRVVYTAESAALNGAWEELASKANFEMSDVHRIVACGNNRVQWTSNFFNCWLLRRPTLAEAVRVILDTSLHDAVDILEPLCSGEALRLVHEWRRKTAQDSLEADAADAAAVAAAEAAVAASLQLIRQPLPHAAGDLVLEYREEPHGAEVTAVATTAASPQTLEEPQMTSCLDALPPDAADQDQVELRCSSRLGEFCGLPVQQLHLVTMTDEARAAAARLRDLHQRLYHPHLAPLLGSLDWPGSMDLYFPQYRVTLEEAYSRRQRRLAQVQGRRFCPPADFDSRLRALFGVAKALLYLHGNAGGQRFLLGNLASSTVMLDSFSCPVICDLTALRELPPSASEDAGDFSADVAAFRLVGLELFTGLSLHHDREDFWAVLREMQAMAASDPESRTQLAYDSDRMVPSEMEPDVPEGDGELSAEGEQSVLLMYFRYQLLVCGLLGLEKSLDSFAGSMRVSKYFASAWSSL